jgi:hypothetical protein
MRSAVRLNSDDASAEAASDVLVIPLPAKIRDAGVDSNECNANPLTPWAQVMKKRGRLARQS